MPSDSELLETYYRTRSEDAFRTLVDRHLPLVYAACCRQLRDEHLAQDATQGVFVILSQKAGKLRNAGLSAWLLVTARYACSTLRRTQVRLKRREQALCPPQQATTKSSTEEMLALLDEALFRLPTTDRQAIALRYLRDEPLADVGQQLGVSEEAARKRVDRSLLKLRDFFHKRGVAATPSAVAGILSFQSHPPVLTPAVHQTLSQGILQACHGTASAASAGLLVAKGTNHMILMTKLKFSTAATMAISLLGIGGWLFSQSFAQAPTPLPAPVVQVPPPTATPATQPAATAPSLDLSTPARTLATLSRAMKEGDRPTALACLAVDPTRPPNLLDLSLANSLAENHKLLVIRRAFPNWPATPPSGVPVEAVIDVLLTIAPPAQISGDSATIRVSIPPQVVNLLPADLSAVVSQWLEQPLYFKKQAGQWKIEADRTVRVELTVFPAMNLAPAEALKRNIALLTDFTALHEQIAQDIENGTLKSPTEMMGFESAKSREIWRRHGATGYSLNAVPATPSSNTLP